MWKKLYAVKETCLEKRNVTIISVCIYMCIYINRKPNDWSICTCAAAAAMNSYTVIFKRLCVCVKIVFRLPLPCLHHTIDELEWALIKMCTGDIRWRLKPVRRFSVGKHV